jgi:hypothetical protein
MLLACGCSTPDRAAMVGFPAPPDDSREFVDRLRIEPGPRALSLTVDAAPSSFIEFAPGAYIAQGWAGDYWGACTPAWAVCRGPWRPRFWR